MSGDYIPFEYPSTADGEFTAVLNEGQILLTRRLQLGLTIQQVADMSGIRFSQYQRLEGGERLFSGCSMKNRDGSVLRPAFESRRHHPSAHSCSPTEIPQPPASV